MFSQVLEKNYTTDFDLQKLKLVTKSIDNNYIVDSLNIILDYAIRENNLKDEIITRRKLGEYYFERAETSKAVNHLLQAKSLSDNSSYKIESAKIYLALFDVYFFLSEYPKAYSLIIKAQDFFKQQKDSFYLASVYNNLAKIERRSSEFSKALSQLELALKYAKVSKNKKTEVNIYINYGAVYIRTKQYELAREYLQKALTLSEEINDINGECEALLKTGASWVLDLDSAEYYINIALNKSLEHKKHFWSGRCLYYLGQIKYETGRRDEAFKDLYLGVGYYDATNDIIMKAGVYRIISNYFIDENNIDSAFFYDKLADQAMDSMESSANIAKVIDLKMDYELKQKHFIIADLNNQKKILDQKHLSDQLVKKWFFICILLLVCISGLLYYSYAQKNNIVKKIEKIEK
ncbi:MAG: tetratricopeptide repeat protein [Flavobacteriales bacterium]|nr:tetratricopeptide repeat protein [Flavobacteriales bacterium]